LLNKQNIKVYLGLHSYSQLLLSPWGYTTDLPVDNDEIEKKSLILTNALQSVYGTQYKYGSSANVLYASSGGAKDWTYGIANILYSWTIELRDTGEFGFLLPTNQIIPSGIETTKAFIALSNAVKETID